VSRSGESVEVAKLLEVLQGHAKVIGVSNDPDSLLAKEADVSIHIGSLPDEMVAIQSYTGTVLTMQLLYRAVVNKRPEDDTELHSALDALPSLIAHEVETATKWDKFLTRKSPPYLLGRGPSYGSVLEGSLLFHETAKAPAVGIHAASFRHGPVETVDGDFAGIVFAPSGVTRNLNLGLARDIVRFGGTLHVIGPGGADTEGLELCETPQVAETLAPLFEIVPVQCAALRLAQLRGLKIGSFRYTPLVTRDEVGFAS
jgi:glucosamine--fructose-6-phosphate aminotransferase (isomerizing)